MAGKKPQQQQQKQEDTAQNSEGSEAVVNEEQLLSQHSRAQTASPSHAAGSPKAATATPAETTSASPKINPNSKDESSITKSSPEKLSITKPPLDPPQNDTSSNQQPSGPKSILKVKHCINRYNNTNTPKQTPKILSASPDGKRHLFPAYEAKNSPRKTTNTNNNGQEPERKVGFIPMARVLTIPSRKDIPLSQKAQVWWQRSDYDDFKKTGRIISKAMECGGSEIWLTSTNAWGKARASHSSKEEEEKSSKEQLVGVENDVDSEYVKALEKYTKRSTKSNNGNNSNDNSTSNNSDFGNKWWCKFGHSRRGLEHIVSSSEGKARQQSVLLAIEMILEEQKRQRVTRTKDPNKLRNVALQYTSWARDLALAAGAADNEAVETNFDLSAKSRSHHFAEKSKHLLNNSVVAGGGVAMAINSQILDENTHGRRNSTVNASTGLKDAHLEHEVSDSSLSKKAQGYIPGGEKDVPASQIMSGMGNMSPRAALKA